MSRVRVLCLFLLAAGATGLAAVAGAGSASSAATCTIYWTGATSSAWTTATNWSLSDGGPSAGVTPAASDFVCMSTAPTRSAVVATSAARTISGIRFNATGSVFPSLTLQGGTFTINTNDSVINNLTAAGTIAGTSTLTVTGSGTFQSTTLTGGTKTVDSGASYAVTGTATLGTTTAAAAMVVNGGLTLSASTLQLSTSGASVAPNTLTVAGALTLSNSASITAVGSVATKPTVVNTGTVTANGTGRKVIGTLFSNSGAVTVANAGLALFQGPVPGAADTGTVAVANGATLEYAGGTRTVATGTISGPGTVDVSGGAVTFGDGTTLTALTVEGGTVSGSITVATLTGSGGTFTGAGTVTTTGSSTVCNLQLYGGYRWLNQGSGAYNANCGYVRFKGGATLENAGSFAVSEGPNLYFMIQDDNAANAVVNDAGATFTVSMPGVNQTFRIGPAFSNAGTVTVTNGSLQLNNGSVPGAPDTGTYSLSSTATIDFGGGARTIGAATITGSGAVVVSGGTVTVTDNLAFPNLTLAGGTVQGTMSVAALTANSGGFAGPGTVTVTGTSTICGLGLSSGVRFVDTAALTYNANCGSINFAGASVFENAGTLTVTGGVNGNTLSENTNDPGNQLVNDAGATITLALATTGGPALRITPTFTNLGTVNLNSGKLFLNDGSAGGVADTGTYSLAAGTTMTFVNGTRTIGAATFTGPGTPIVDGGTVTFTSPVALSPLVQSGGTLTFANGQTVATFTRSGGVTSGSPTIAAFTGTNGSFNGTGTATLTGTSTLCQVQLTGGYRLLNQGTLSYATACGYVEFAGNSVLENAGSFTVTAPPTGNYFYDDDGAAGNGFVNDASGTFTATGSSAATLIRFTVGFSNAGTVNVTAGKLLLNSGTVPGTPDTGTYNVAAGARVIFGGGQRSVGTATVTGAGDLEIAGGSTTFTAGVTLPNLTVSGGNVAGTFTVGVLTFTAGGQFTGAGTLTVTGTGSTAYALDLEGGYRLVNQGATTITGPVYLYGGSQLENAGSLTLTGSGYGVYDDVNTGTSLLNDAGAIITANLLANNTASISARFTNNGTLVATRGAVQLSTLTNLASNGVLTGGAFTAAGGTIGFSRGITTNNATLTLGATGGLNIGGTSGSAIAPLSANTGTLTIGQTLTGTASSFTNTGTVAVTGGTWRVTTFTQTSGSTTVAAGATLRSGANGTSAVAVNGGVLAGSGTVQGALAGVGTIQPGTAGAGTLAVTGTWNAAPATTLAVSAGATSTTLAVSGAAAVAGTLAISTVQPTPAVGTTVNVVTAGSLTGTFATVTGVDVPASGAFWAVGYTPTAVTLTLTAYPTVSVTGGSVAEGNSGTVGLAFTVSLSAASSQTVTVAYATADGTATAGQDYAATSGTLSFTPGQTTQTVTVPVAGDTLYEADETVVMTLSAPSSAVLGTGSASGTIVNDDGAPAISVGSASGTVGAGSGATLVFPVTLSTVSGLDATVSWSTSDGTAVSPTDYTGGSGTVTIPAGSTSASITIAAPAQAGYAPPKTFTVTLTNPVDATLGTATATGTINNSNPSGGTPSVASVTPSASAQGTSVAVVVNGQNLPADATVSVSGTGVTVSNVVVSTTSRITATFTVAAGATPGARNVAVSGTGGSATCTACFTVTAKPTLTTPLGRTAFAAGNVDAQLDVTGAGFQPGTTLRFVKGTKSVDATSVTVDSASALTARFTLAANTTLGSWSVVVTNPDGGTSTCTNCVTVFAAPKVASVSPSSVARGTATAMTFTGIGFVAGTRVSVQGATLSNVVVVNATTITATVTFPAGATTGSKTVKVFNPASAGSGTGTTAAAVTVTG